MIRREESKEEEYKTESKGGGICSCENPWESLAAPHGFSQRLTNPLMGTVNLQLLPISFALCDSFALTHVSQGCVSRAVWSTDQIIRSQF